MLCLLLLNVCGCVSHGHLLRLRLLRLGLHLPLALRFGSCVIMGLRGRLGGSKRQGRGRRHRLHMGGCDCWLSSLGCEHWRARLLRLLLLRLLLSG